MSCIYPGRRAVSAAWRPIIDLDVLLCLSLITSLSAILSRLLWWWFNHETRLLYVESQFYCVVSYLGQRLISFGIFGLEKHLKTQINSTHCPQSRLEEDTQKSLPLYDLYSGKATAFCMYRVQI